MATLEVVRIDQQSLMGFEQNLKDNVYELIDSVRCFFIESSLLFLNLQLE